MDKFGINLLFFFAGIGLRTAVEQFQVWVKGKHAYKEKRG